MFYCLDGPGSSISFNPADESITKIQGQSVGPIVCSAQCNPPCQFYWIKPDGFVVHGSNLEIPNLSKNDHGTVICHAGNDYGSNATKNLLLTVKCKYLMIICEFKILIMSTGLSRAHILSLENKRKCQKYTTCMLRYKVMLAVKIKVDILLKLTGISISYGFTSSINMKNKLCIEFWITLILSIKC
jgi:hypothetical protein